MSSGMDDLSREQRELSISFADSMTTIEGIEPGEATLNDLSEWRKGEKPFLVVLEVILSDMLIQSRYEGSLIRR